jgi:hypothetical protein
MQLVQGASLHLLRDLDVDLDSFLVLGEVPEHLSMVFQAFDTRGEQLVQPPWVEGFRLDQVIYAANKVGTRGVDGSHHHFVAQHEPLVDHVRVHLDFLLTSRHTREHQHSIFAQRLSCLKDQRTEAGREAIDASSK